MENELTQDYVRELFDYKDGVLYWKVVKAARIKVGDTAGYVSNGYLLTRVNGKNYKNHRLVWLYEYGYFPENDIDHIDRDCSNNKINNLREVSRQCNLRNTGDFNHNTSGVKGVSWCNRAKKWRAYIKINQKNKHLGRYEDFDNAVCARLAAEQCLGWSGCDKSSPAFKYVKNMVNQ